MKKKKKRKHIYANKYRMKRIAKIRIERKDKKERKTCKCYKYMNCTTPRACQGQGKCKNHIIKNPSKTTQMKRNKT